MLQAIQSLEAQGLIQLVCAADDSNAMEPGIGRHLSARGVRVYDDFQHLFEHEHDFHALIIADGIPSHARLTATALARGLFVYLCQPPVPLIQQLNDLIALDSRQKVGVGFDQIHLSQIRQLKTWTAEGRLGALNAIRVKVSKPRFAFYYEEFPWVGKMILNKEPVLDGPATHEYAGLLHAIMYLGGATMEEYTVPTEVEGEFYRVMPIESYDLCGIRGNLASGTAFHFIGSRASKTVVPFRIELVGDRGKAWYQEGAATAENDCGLKASVFGNSDPAVESLKQFIDFVKGRCLRPAVRLEDVRGYLLASNGGLMGSGGIHSVPSEHWKEYREGQQFAYEVIDLPALMERSIKEGKLFAELNIPWARKGTGVSVRSLRSLSLKDYISH